jgi:krimper
LNQQVAEQFLLKLEDGMMMRCVRVPLDNNSNLDPTVFMQIRLIDTGESFVQEILEIPDNSVFELPEALGKIPGRAVECKLQRLEVDHSFDSAFEFIADKLYEKVTLEVVGVAEDNVLLVNVSQFVSESISQENATASPQPPQRFTKEILTEREREILEEEPLNTGNPQVAIQGFVTRDDHRLCKFYDPKIGGCFKGGRCRQRHVLEITDGSCRDTQKISFRGIPKILHLPPLHSSVRIEITHFYSVNKFVCCYRKLKPTKEHVDLEQLMNSEEQVKDFIPIKFTPAINQLVVFKSPNEKFYRARVEKISGENVEAELLLVDMGIVETAAQKQIFEWRVEFNFVPFQAVEMEIANIEPLSDNANEAEGIEVIKQHMQANKNTLKARVFDNIPGIKVKLFSKDEEDIGQELVDRKLALERVVAPPLTNQLVIPG